MITTDTLFIVFLLMSIILWGTGAIRHASGNDAFLSYLAACLSNICYGVALACFAFLDESGELTNALIVFAYMGVALLMANHTVIHAAENRADDDAKRHLRCKLNAFLDKQRRQSINQPEEAAITESVESIHPAGNSDASEDDHA